MAHLEEKSVLSIVEYKHVYKCENRHTYVFHSVDKTTLRTFGILNFETQFHSEHICNCKSTVMMRSLPKN